MSPERVSVGEEGEGHSMVMDRKQKRRGNQQWRVWCQESGKNVYNEASKLMVKPTKNHCCFGLQSESEEEEKEKRHTLKTICLKQKKKKKKKKEKRHTLKTICLKQKKKKKKKRKDTH